MFVQVERIGEPGNWQFLARVRTRGTVYLWDVFWTPQEAEKWGVSQLGAAKSIQVGGWHHDFPAGQQKQSTEKGQNEIIYESSQAGQNCHW